MKNVLILIALFFIVRYLKKRFFDRPKAAETPVAKGGEPSPSIDGEETALDPVCGSYVPVSSAIKLMKAGNAEYFCSEECLRRAMEKG